MKKGSRNERAHSAPGRRKEVYRYLPLTSTYFFLWCAGLQLSASSGDNGDSAPMNPSQRKTRSPHFHRRNPLWFKACLTCSGFSLVRCLRPGFSLSSGSDPQALFNIIQETSRLLLFLKGFQPAIPTQNPNRYESAQGVFCSTLLRLAPLFQEPFFSVLRQPRGSIAQVEGSPCPQDLAVAGRAAA